MRAIIEGNGKVVLIEFEEFEEVGRQIRLKNYRITDDYYGWIGGLSIKQDPVDSIAESIRRH